MRAISLIFLTVGYAASAVGPAGAGQSVAASQQAPSRSVADTVGNHSREADHAAPTDDRTHIGKTSGDQPNHPKVSGNKAPAANASLSKPSRRNKLANRRERSASEGSMNSDHPGSDKTVGAVENGRSRDETAHNAATVPQPSAVRPSVPSLSNVRHRGANPAIVGGVGISNARNSGALDGKHMNRRRTGN
jgi:hypothetical protein